MHSPTHSTTSTCSHSRTNFLTTPPGRPDTPPGRALALHSQQITQSAQPPPRPRPSRTEHMAPGAAGNRPEFGAPAPLSPPPRIRLGAPAPPQARKPGGAGALEERKLTCLSQGRKKVWFPPPSPAARRWLTLRGAGLAEPARSALCSELGPEGEGRGLGSHLRAAPPPLALRPDSMLAAPCPGDCALPPREARLTLGLPEGPGAHKLSSGRQPHAPRFLGPPGSDRCLRDRLSFVPKERGTRAGSPALPAPGPSRCPHPQLSL